VRSNPHAIHSQLLQQISDPTLPKDERARLRCQLAKGLEDVGSFETAREAMGELWAGVGERPDLAGLEEATAAEVLLRAGTLTGWLGSAKQIEGSQEAAKNLITESITRFEALGDVGRVAEAQTEVAFCYWRQGSHNEARVWLQEALGRLPSGTHDEVRVVALLRLAIIERSAKRFHDALRIHIDSAPLFQKNGSDALKGKFHHGFAFLLRNLGAAEKRPDYIDRALIEYAAASYHFEQAGAAARYQGCVENNLGLLFGTLGKFREAHEHLDRAQALFTGMKDIAHTAGVDETRAKVLLAEGRINEAERLARSAVRILERGGEQSLLAEALTTHGIALARGGNMKDGLPALQRAVKVADEAGDTESAGLAALSTVEELGKYLPADELTATYDRAADLLSRSGNQELKDRLLTASRNVLFLIGEHPTPPTWKGFNFYDAVLRFEARVISRALAETGGVVSRAAELLGLKRQALDSMLKVGRHKALGRLRAPIRPRLKSLMFRDEVDCAETRAVVVLYVGRQQDAPDPALAKLEEEGWSVEACSTGAQALERLRGGRRFDVLIFGYKLPDMTGVELIRQTRALAHRQRTPLIMLTDYDVEDDALRAGATLFLRSSGAADSIAETVARLLARKKRTESGAQ
jgi:CheY-like chemotaxis protein/tetratricopeptide (TPR) repeat protein